MNLKNDWYGETGKATGFTHTKGNGGTLTFSMTEKIGGFMFPLYANYIPPFDKAFEQFAADLKSESETIQSSKK